MADLRDMAAVILFCGGWRRQWLAQNAHFPEMPLAKKKKKNWRNTVRSRDWSVLLFAAKVLIAHAHIGFMRVKKKKKPQTDNFTKKKEETAGMRFLFWNWPRPSLFFFISSLGCLWLHFLDIRKLVRYSFAFETNRIAPTFSLSFVIIQIGAFKCRSDQLSQRLLRTAMTKCSWPITNGLLFVRGRTQGKGTTKTRKSSFARVSLSSVPFCCLLLTAFTTFCQGWPSLLFLWVSTFSFKDVQGFFSRSLVFAFVAFIPPALASNWHRRCATRQWRWPSRTFRISSTHTRSFRLTWANLTPVPSPRWPFNLRSRLVWLCPASFQLVILAAFAPAHETLAVGKGFRGVGRSDWLAPITRKTQRICRSDARRSIGFLQFVWPFVDLFPSNRLHVIFEWGTFEEDKLLEPSPQLFFFVFSHSIKRRSSF